MLTSEQRSQQKSAVTSSISINNIKKSVASFGESLDSTKKTSIKLNTTLVQSSKFRRQSITIDRSNFQKRRESVRRKEQEGIIEASGIGGAIKRQGKVIAQSTKGFLGRIFDFIGTLMVGWLLNNLPIIINLGEQLIKRIQKLVGILSRFVQNTISILSGFGNLLSGIFSNLITFDFTDQSGKINAAINQMKFGVSGIENNFDSAIKLLSEPLDLGFDKLEIPGDKDQQDRGDQKSESGGGGGGTPGASGQLQPIHKQALDIISGPESGGNYNAMNNGKAGDRPGGSKKWLGKNLTDMTIGEVKYFQNSKKTLWAAGRYQIIPGTLPTAQSAAGLKDTDKFDEANQDLLGIGLLKVQGPGAWSKYSKYSKQEIDIMYKAKNTTLGQPAPTPKSPSTQITPTSQVSTSVVDQFKGKSGSPAGTITDTFGYSASRGRNHNGIDIAPAGPGYYVSFKGTGTVVYSQFNTGGYGNLVIIQSGNTHYYFAHLAKRFVKSGSYSGQTIGEIGNTGGSTGIHLHFEIRLNASGPFTGQPIDPRPYINLLSIGRKLTGVSGIQSQTQNLTPSLTPAQIQTKSPSSGQNLSQQLTPEKTGQTVYVPIDQMQQQPMPPRQQYSSSSNVNIPTSDEIPLNRMMIQQLLLDLAYT